MLQLFFENCKTVCFKNCIGYSVRFEAIDQSGLKYAGKQNLSGVDPRDEARL